MGIVAHYDNFIYQMAKAIIRNKPHLVFNKDAVVAYSDLNSFSSMEDAKNHIVEKELEKILRESHEDQLKWFSNALEVKIEPRKELFIDFVEICERRNLFAHTGGRASKHYVDKGNKMGYIKSPIEVGKILRCSPKYFKDSVDVLIEISFQLLSVVWNKIDPESGEEISKSLINITYSLIQEEKYLLAIRLIEYVLTNKSYKMDESTKKHHVINWANASKLAGLQSYRDILNKEDWTASTDDFLICRAAILDDVKKVVMLMDRVIKSGRMKQSDFKDWPVFKDLRKNEIFSKKYQEIFGEPLYLAESNLDNHPLEITNVGSHSDLPDLSKDAKSKPVKVRRAKSK